MRSPASINLVLMAGGTTLFGAATILHQHQHQRDCQAMRDQAIPDPDGHCTQHSSGGGAHGGGWHYSHSNSGSSTGAYTRASTSVVRGGFGATGARYGGFGFHGFG